MSFADEISFHGFNTGSAALALARRPASWREAPKLLERLSEQELERFREISNPQAASNWLLGRLLAKSLIFRTKRYETLQWKDVTIQSRNAANQSVRPTAWCSQQPLSLSLALSHFNCSALVAISDEERIRLGVDLVAPEAVRPSVQRTWFTECERQFARQSDDAAAQIWAAKEAAYKAMHRGEPFQPLQFEVTPTSRRRCIARYDAPWRPKPLRVTTWTTPCGHVAAYATCENSDCETLFGEEL